MLSSLFDDQEGWLTTPKERAMLVGLLQVLSPERALEIGVYRAGYTKWLAQFCEEVVCVDIEQRWDKLPENCSFMHMTSEKAICELFAQGKFFDFVMIDADHSSEGACKDLTGALMLGHVVVMHDTYNPECRRGYLKAIDTAKNIRFKDIDWVVGADMAQGKWGGLGLVVTQ